MTQSMDSVQLGIRERPMAENPSNSFAVICRGVTKEFDAGDSKVFALRGVDLEVPPGQMTLLVGPSGCGKTTLLSVVAGILEPTAGRVAVLGNDLGSISKGAKVRFRRDNVGFVFQQFNLLPGLTASENAAVPLIIAGVSRREAVQRAFRLLDAMGMGKRGTPRRPISQAANSSESPSRPLSMSRVCSFATSRRRCWTRRRDTPLWSCCAVSPYSRVVASSS